MADIAEYQEQLNRRLNQDPDGIAVMKAIRETGALSKEDDEKLKSVLEGFTKSFLTAKSAGTSQA